MATGAADNKQKVLDYFSGNFHPFYAKHLPHLKKISGDEWAAVCPFHGDKDPSLNVNARTGLFYCHGCGAKGDVFSFYGRLHGLSNGDFPKALEGIASDFGIVLQKFSKNGEHSQASESHSKTPPNGDRLEEQKPRIPSNEGKGTTLENDAEKGNGQKKNDGQPRPRITATYDYHNANGEMFFQVVRKEPGPDGKKKDFLQRRPDGNGGWIWKMKGIELVLYHFPEVMAADEVFLVEGEKDVDALRALGITATTNPMGAGKWRQSYNETLRGKDVVLLPDNDETGRKHMLHVAGELHGKAKSIKLLVLPGLPDKGDVSDFIATYDDPAEAAERLAIMVEGAVEWEPEEEAAPEQSPWDCPVDLPSLIECVPAPHRWLFENRIPDGRGIVISGVGGSSKTRCIYQLAVGAVLGRVAWNWTVNRTGRALLVLTEDVAEDVHRTVYQICDGLALTMQERRQVYAGLVIYPMAGKSCTLLEKDGTGAMVETPLFHSLERKIKDHGDVVFTGMDPALSLTTGDEMDQGQQRALGRMVDNLAVRTSATCALVAHATKASLNRDELDSHNSRGGGAITDVLRAEYAMRTMTATEGKKAGIDDLEERKRHVQLVATKGNTLPPDAYVPVWLRRDHTGTLAQADIVFNTGGREPGKKDMEALDVLRTMAATATPTLKEWKAECVDRGIVSGTTPDAQKKAMQRIVQKLSDAEFIHRGIGRGIWVPGGENAN